MLYDITKMLNQEETVELFTEVGKCLLEDYGIVMLYDSEKDKMVFTELDVPDKLNLTQEEIEDDVRYVFKRELNISLEMKGLPEIE